LARRFLNLATSFLPEQPLMNADLDAQDGRAPEFDQELFLRKLETLETYLLAVARSLKGRRARPSDLVHSVLADAIAKVRNGDKQLRDMSDEKLMGWLRRNLKYANRGSLRRGRRFDEILKQLPLRGSGRTVSSEFRNAERAKRAADAWAGLDPADREMILWRHVEQIRFREIGLRRGYSASYARRAWLDAQQKLCRIYQSLRPAASPSTDHRPAVSN
jgi:DNA-directed RNA polymerase specialized sigma24 family protein